MAKDLVKRFIKKDGLQRISFYRDEYADNPRYMTDEPLHCEDWSSDYSIMDKHERETKSVDAGKLIRYLMARYGDDKKIITILKDNYKSNKHERYDNALSYNRSRQEWILWTWQPSWKDYDGNTHEAHWEEEFSFCCKIDNLEICVLTDYLSDEQIDAICKLNLFTNEVKINSYGFGYNGDIHFYHDFSTNSEGICWLEKDEFLKYSGCSEEYWNGNTLDEITWLVDALEAWSNNEVYGFVVEDYEVEEWEESDSCWGFYGEPDKIENDMFYYADVNKGELEEVAV